MTNFYQNIIKKDKRFNHLNRIGDLDLLEPSFRARVQAIVSELAAAGIQVRIIETYRSKARQQDLYLHKHTKLKRVGVHHYGLACDFVYMVNGKPSWSGSYAKLGELAKKHKLVWGGSWKTFKDLGHVQMCSLKDQTQLFAEKWYPQPDYDATE